MAMLWMDGFDWIDPAADAVALQYALNCRYRSADMIYSSPDAHCTPGRSGGTGLHLYHYAQYFRTPALQEIGVSDKVFIGYAVKINQLGLDLSPIRGYRLGSQQFVFQLRASDGFARLYPGGSWFDPGFQVGSWYYVELYVCAHPSLGEYEVRINGVTKCQGTGVDMAQQSAAGWTNIFFYSHASVSGGAVYDDIYVLDDQGSVNNGFLGDVKISTLRPTGDAVTQWSRSEGNENFALVDEGPVDPACEDVWNDRDYVSSGVSGKKDLYDHENLSAEFRGSPIQAVQLVSAVRTTNPQIVTLNSKCLSGVTEVDIRSDPLAGDKYLPIIGIQETDPETGILWTPGGLNAAQFGVEVD